MNAQAYGLLDLLARTVNSMKNDMVLFGEDFPGVNPRLETFVSILQDLEDRLTVEMAFYENLNVTDELIDYGFVDES